jgi:putative ABC transport system permease protein
MFGTYLRRELRRRARQASIIAIGLALGIGLVITVTALSAGVKNAQGNVLHSLYGLDTDITVTKAPATGSFTGGAGGRFGFGGQGSGSRPKAGTTISIDRLSGTGYGSLTSADVTKVAGLKNVAAAAGSLVLTDTKDTITIPNFSQGGGFGSGSSGSGSSGSGQHFGNFTQPTSISVDAVAVSGTGAALGPLSSATTASGKTFTAADANSDVAVVDSSYAKSDNLKVGSTVTLAKTGFKVIGIVSQSGSNPPQVFIPLARGQALATAGTSSLKGDVNTIYVAANSASNITPVSSEISAQLTGATVTNENTLGSQLTGSLSNASTLAGNLGKWLAIAVLVAAFLLASLLTTSAVSRRVREFGTLKALGWTSRRVVGQVVGEALVIGVIGGIVGVGLGFLGSTLVSKSMGTLTASVGPTTGSATPGGARAFTGSGANGFGGGGFGGGGFGGGGNGSNAGFAGGFRRAATDAAHTVPVHLSAPVTLDAVIAAVLLAVLGGLIAGSFGGWRAARLRPAMALARVE